MLVVLVCLVVAGIGIYCSFPLAEKYYIPKWQIPVDFFSALIYCGLVCAVFLFLFRFLTKLHFNPESKFFKIPKYETKLYNRLGVKKWHKYIPDWGGLVGFKKDLNSNTNYSGGEKNSKFYHRFIYENVNAECLHGFTILASPVLFAFINPHFYASIGTSVMIIVIIVNLVPVILQRYNRPRLIALYKKTKKKEEQTQQQIVIK